MLSAKRFLACLFALLFLFTACGTVNGNKNNTTETTETPGTGVSGTDVSDAEVSFPYTFTDSTGASVTLEKVPKTVAVLFSSFAEVWTLAGGQVDVTVGESVTRGFASDSAILVDPSAGHTTLDLETLIAAAPDLVIATADYACQTDAATLCRNAGIPAALFRVECFDDYLTMLAICTRITGREDLYRQNGTQVKARIDAIFAQVAAYRQNGAKTPEILFVRAGSAAKSTKAKTAADHFACAMLEELGAVNIAESKTTLTGTLSTEVVMEADPDYLFITTMGDEVAARAYMDSVLASAGWRELSCVTAGRCHYLPKSLFHFKPNARWAEAYEMLAKILYPGLAL